LHYARDLGEKGGFSQGVGMSERAVLNGGLPYLPALIWLVEQRQLLNFQRENLHKKVP